MSCHDVPPAVTNSVIKKTQTMIANHNRQVGNNAWTSSKSQFIHRKSAATTASPPLPSHQYPPFALGMCVRMVYTLKTNRHPIATVREIDVGLDKVVDGGRRDGMERKRQETGSI